MAGYDDDMYSFLDADDADELERDEGGKAVGNAFSQRKDMKIYLIDAHAAMARPAAA
eukprot:SAG22_NODE_5434_length_1014_cov_1.245902_2_plen_56_part_01